MKEVLTTQWLEEIDSTNTEIVRRLPNLDNLSVLAALSQTAGRGQRGNKWLAPKGENLTFSMLIRFSDTEFSPIPATRQFDISIAATLGTSDYLASKGIECKIKWPNDIYVRNRKICGMLIENSLCGSNVSTSIIGIGLNVNQKAFDPQLMNPTSMTLVTGCEYDIRQELTTLCEFIKARLLKMGTQKDEYVARLYRIGAFHEFCNCSDGSKFEGRIEGITESGTLLLKTKEGKLKEFAFKEISYII